MIKMITDDQALRDSVAAQISSISNSLIWAAQYQAPAQIVEDGQSILVAELRFNHEVDRNVLDDAISDISGMLSSCEIGTKITLHDCGHDSDNTCTETLIYEVV
jgi:hypothetical protein